MPSTTQHGSRVVYVAGLSADLPDVVQAWLNEHSVPQSPDIYDALATLAGRHRPVALIVNIEAVDWQEMDFFDVATRIHRDTRIYVVGPDYLGAKMDAAVAKGAHRFSSEDLAEDLARPTPGSQRPGVRDLLAGSLRQATRRGVRPPATSRSGRADLVLVPTPSERPANERSEITSIATEVKPAHQPAASATAKAASPSEPLAEADASPPEPPRQDPPNVRLVGLTEERSRQPLEPEKPATPFPWAPSTARPKRIPPAPMTAKPAANDAQPSDPDATAPTASAVPPESVPNRSTAPLPVELTADELAALIGKSSRLGSTSCQGERQG